MISLVAQTKTILYSVAAILWSSTICAAQDSKNLTALTLNGSATMITLGNQPVLELTAAEASEAGSAFTTKALQFNAEYTFDIFFQFRMAGGSGGADGMAFILQTEGPTALGGSGGCLGYLGNNAACPSTPAGITPSVAVEFDTYENAGDINDNHIAILTDGNFNDLDPQTPYGVTDCSVAGTFGCMNNGDTWSVWVQYDGTNLNVALADNSTTRPPNLIAYPIDLLSTLGQTAAYVGFSAGTGDDYQGHYVFNIR